jgi:hypothetical protein
LCVLAARCDAAVDTCDTIVVVVVVVILAGGAAVRCTVQDTLRRERLERESREKQREGSLLVKVSVR